ncbi:MAG: hypothetical protein PHI64_12805 [Zoogloea sp.]|nr:hypothetical protein [Zoogloea sp.]MDD2989828.1 hypothetical protein [Zoogloea sp.]
MPDRPTPWLVRVYTEHRDVIDAAIGTATWAAMLATLLFVGAS